MSHRRVRGGPTPCGDATRGDVLFPRKENIPPYTPQEKGTRGLPPRPRTLQVCSSKSCAACGIRCGVHGFAMNPYYSLPIATAPYYREARVTLARRQTACGMRHCFARRIVGTGGRRKLVCTPTRSAERHPQGVCRIRKASEPPTAAQQRVVGAEASRVATLNAATLRASISIPEAKRSFEIETANLKPFSWGI